MATARDLFESSVEAVRYLNRVSADHNCRWDLRVLPGPAALNYHIAYEVPRPRKDGSLGKRRLVRYTDRYPYPDDAIIEAAAIIQSHLAGQGAP